MEGGKKEPLERKGQYNVGNERRKKKTWKEYKGGKSRKKRKKGLKSCKEEMNNKKNIVVKESKIRSVIRKEGKGK